MGLQAVAKFGLYQRQRPPRGVLSGLQQREENLHLFPAVLADVVEDQGIVAVKAFEEPRQGPRADCAAHPKGALGKSKLDGQGGRDPYSRFRVSTARSYRFRAASSAVGSSGSHPLSDRPAPTTACPQGTAGPPPNLRRSESTVRPSPPVAAPTTGGRSRTAGQSPHTHSYRCRVLFVVCVLTHLPKHGNVF